MLQIYIARHGQNLDNERGILNGHRDEPLTLKGREQAEELTMRIQEAGLSFDAVYSSPLSRAFDTAITITNTLGAPAPQKDMLLIERDFGVMTGQKAEDIERLCAPYIIKTDTITYFLKPEQGETFPQVLERATAFLSKVQQEHTDGTILCVCHGDFGKMLYAAYYQLDWKEVLQQFHFGNAELLLLSENSPAEESHVVHINQQNA